jgi:large subunit ribosomal protein L3
MAGRMGNERKTVKNLKVFQVDAERNLLIIKGAVPGPRNGIVWITK